jgi:hypothetical protein
MCALVLIELQCGVNRWVQCTGLASTYNSDMSSQDMTLCNAHVLALDQESLFMWRDTIFLTNPVANGELQA